MMHLLMETLETQSKVKITTCSHCKRKTGLLHFACKCGGTFCMKCRLAEVHDCAYDWKAQPITMPPRVVAAKVPPF